jgi:molybdate transport system substrate-binding protein
MTPQIAPLRLLGPVALRSQLSVLARQFSARTDIPVDMQWALNPEIPDLIRGGTGFDVGVTNPWYVKDLIDEGFVKDDTHAAFGRVMLASGAGTINTEAPQGITEDVVALMRDAQTIAYTGAGTSGATFLRILDQLGILAEVGGKCIPMNAGAPVRAAATGKADLAIAPLTTILSADGVTLRAVFPAEMDAHIDMSMFAASSAPGHMGATQFLEFLGAHSLNDVLADMGISRFALT